MKRIIPLMLLVALCLTLIACTEAELPEVNEEIQGEEIQEEIEGETPEETPEEPVVPEEPETPDDIPEEPEEVIDYITVKIEKDGVTTEKRFEFPEGFNLKYYSEYVEPELTAPENFNFGEWGLFVEFDSFHYTAEPTSISSYALITDKTNNTDEAILLYKEFNDRFKIVNPIPELEGDEKKYIKGESKENLIGEKMSFESEMLPHFTYGEYLYGSCIYSISPDVNEVKRRTLFDRGDDRKLWDEFMLNGWDCTFDTLDIDGNVLKSTTVFETDVQGHCRSESEESIEAYEKILEENIHLWGNNRYYDHLNSGNLPWGHYSFLNGSYRFVKEDHELDCISGTMYKTENGKIIENSDEMSVYIESNEGIEIKEYDGEKIYINIVEEEAPLKFKGGIYTYDIKKGIIEHFEDNLYIFPMTLSPDGKYIAYLCDDVDTMIYPMVEDGFYIKEIETGKTTFYSIEDIGWINKTYINILNWVKTDKIEEVINR